MNCDWCGKDIPLKPPGRKLIIYNVTILGRDMIICYFCKRMAEDYRKKGGEERADREKL